MIHNLKHSLDQTLTYALCDTCRNPQYLEALRREVDNSWRSDGSPSLRTMLLLDAILRESARLSPSETISLRRKAIDHYTFADGFSIRKDDILCAPFCAMGQDASNFADPRVFSPERYYDKTEYTHKDPRYPFWGLGKESCPGRFYIALIMKSVLAHLLRKYDIKLADEGKAATTFSWRTTNVPGRGSFLMIRRRRM
ncbi:MAG: hypothetical protein Q9213_004883 [Squamulea squamosa]